MALKLSRATQYGVKAEYWKIINVEISHHAKRCNCYVGGFVSEEARREGKAPLEVIGVQINGEDFNLTSDANIYAALYTLLKTRVEFAGCLDV